LVEQAPLEMRRGVSWVKPELVCEVEFLAWTQDGVLRQASFEALREDKSPRDVVRERPQAARETKEAMRKPSEPKSAPTGRDSAVAGIAITHASRVVFPDIGAT